jgi:hypothetical protein
MLPNNLKNGKDWHLLIINDTIYISQLVSMKRLEKLAKILNKLFKDGPHSQSGAYLILSFDFEI